jgi:hypothetical protein
MRTGTRKPYFRRSEGFSIFLGDLMMGRSYRDLVTLVSIRHRQHPWLAELYLGRVVGALLQFGTTSRQRWGTSSWNFGSSIGRGRYATVQGYRMQAGLNDASPQSGRGLSMTTTISNGTLRNGGWAKPTRSIEGERCIRGHGLGRGVRVARPAGPPAVDYARSR